MKGITPENFDIRECLVRGLLQHQALLDEIGEEYPQFRKVLRAEMNRMRDALRVAEKQRTALDGAERHSKLIADR